MTENEVAREIVDAAYKIHRMFGPGLLESAYEAMLAHELQKRGLRVRRQVPIPLVYEDLRVEEAYRADLLVEEIVIVELKAVEEMPPVSFRQALTHLKLTGKRLGLLLNFGEHIIKNGLHRIANGMPE